MAFNIFLKSSKPGTVNRKLELEGVPTISGHSKLGAKAPNRAPTDTEMGNWTPLAGHIEVDETAPLGPSLENAALMFAHGNATAATAALTHALDTPERTQPMVWMCLFDLHARNADRTAFEELALRFVVQFERSAPAWDELATGGTGTSANAHLLARAKPKSVNFATPCGVKIMFFGFTSRWIRPRLWAWARASAIWIMMSSASASPKLRPSPTGGGCMTS